MRTLKNIACSVPLLVVAIAAAPAGETASCETAFQSQQSSLTLTYDGFDQTPGEGWRALAQQACMRQAAKLIESYLDTREDLSEGQRRNMSFHAGQLLAMENDYAAAIPLFERALKESEPEDAPFKWNAYVSATIAFLKNDGETLEKYREKMAQGKEVHGTAPNLDVVEGLSRNLGKPYKEAYSDR